MKRVFGILLLLVICVSVFFWWKGRVRDKALNDGEFTCDGCMSPERKEAFLKENSGEDAEGQLEHKSTRHNELLEDKGVKTTTTVATSTAPVSTATTTPAAATTTTTTVGTTTYPAATPAAPVASSVTYSGPTTPVATTTTSVSTTSAKTPVGAPPAYDTIAPNAPNGAIFTGSGAYQWYRQGNLTWRVDSRTGRSCIVFATDEEWRKERVMSHGCGKSA